MIKIRRSKERGYEDRGWIESFYTFTFENYLDPNWMGFHNLRVFNEGILKEGKGFSAHHHKEIEILTYVVEGVMEREDSFGKTSLIRPGELLHLSAGSGVTHTEYNLSHHLPLHFFELWINPKIHGTPPHEEKKIFSSAAKWGRWCLIASANGRDGSFVIRQDVDIYLSLLEKDEDIGLDTLADRYYWLQILSGSFHFAGHDLHAGDAAIFSEESTVSIACQENGELMLIELAEL